MTRKMRRVLKTREIWKDIDVTEEDFSVELLGCVEHQKKTGKGNHV